MTDNRTNEPTEAQVEAAAKAHRKHGKGAEYMGIVCRECDEYFEDRAGFDAHRMRAALVAAAGAAPQAASETIIGAVMRTTSMACHIALAADGMAESHGAGCGHVPILTPAVQQVSESDLADVIRAALYADEPDFQSGSAVKFMEASRRAVVGARAVVAALGGESR